MTKRNYKRKPMIKSFNNSMNNLNEMITYFKDEKKIRKKKQKASTISKSVDTLVFIATTSTSVTWYCT